MVQIDQAKLALMMEQLAAFQAAQGGADNATAPSFVKAAKANGKAGRNGNGKGAHTADNSGNPYANAKSTGPAATYTISAQRGSSHDVEGWWTAKVPDNGGKPFSTQFITDTRVAAILKASGK